MDLEPILYVLAAVPVVHRFLASQARLSVAAEHAIKQNSELMARQTVILESVVSILNTLGDRVADLEEEGDEVTIQGFRAEDEEGDEEGEDDEEPQPVNRSRAGFRRRT